MFGVPGSDVLFGSAIPSWYSTPSGKTVSAPVDWAPSTVTFSTTAVTLAPDGRTVFHSGQSLAAACGKIASPAPPNPARVSIPRPAFPASNPEPPPDRYP